MKKIIVSIAVLVVPLLAVAQHCAGCGQCGGNDRDAVRITVLHTNDTHSTVMPLGVNLDDTLKAGRGGFLRRIAMVRQERMKDEGLLLFDSGDFSQGSPYYTVFGGEVEIGLMNRMGYDAATIGNHKFDYGLENMAKIFRMAKFPIVCANYDFTGTEVEGLVKPYVVIERKGLKIGVFGLGPQLDGLVSASCYGGTKYHDPIETARKTASLLKDSMKCDVVVCLSHLGWKESRGIDDVRLIESTKGIDLVLGGHSHTYMKGLERVRNADGVDVPVDQNGKHGIYVGKLVMDVEKRK